MSKLQNMATLRESNETERQTINDSKLRLERINRKKSKEIVSKNKFEGDFFLDVDDTSPTKVNLSD